MPALPHDALFAFECVHLDRLKLATDILLGEPDTLPTALESELVLYRDRLEHALLRSVPAT